MWWLSIGQACWTQLIVDGQHIQKTAIPLGHSIAGTHWCHPFNRAHLCLSTRSLSRTPATPVKRKRDRPNSSTACQQASLFWHESYWSGPPLNSQLLTGPDSSVLSPSFTSARRYWVELSCIWGICADRFVQTCIKWDSLRPSARGSLAMDLASASDSFSISVNPSSQPIPSTLQNTAYEIRDKRIVYVYGS